ncbi:MAG: helix-turn-helix domain-containing protein, partial [Chloroflexota bacterium]
KLVLGNLQILLCEMAGYIKESKNLRNKLHEFILELEATQNGRSISPMNILKEALITLFSETNLSVVFIIKNFELAIQGFPGSLMADIATLQRPTPYWDRPLFVTTTTDSWVKLFSEAGLQQLLELDEFERDIWLKPLKENEIDKFLKHVMPGHTLHPSLYKTLFTLSGGWPLLLRQVARLFAEDDNEYDSMLLHLIPDELLRLDTFCVICEKIWYSLKVAEQIALKNITSAQTISLNRNILHSLRKKGLIIHDTRGQVHIHGSIFADYVKFYATTDAQVPEGTLGINQEETGTPQKSHLSDASGVYLDTASKVDIGLGEVWLNNICIREGENVTRLEFRLLAYLVQHEGKNCKVNDIQDFVYADMPEDILYETDNNRLRAHVKRLRQKLEEIIGFRPIYTVQAVGYRFSLTAQH